ncbi:MAG: MogA/MoaB family molybdenum cofactor biosynthesis protein [Blastocatellia bacterium]|nr:MogA/MoaB family molybdenum cofactor biosynthesis protein [Blastocatellia bacterium]
METKKTHAHSSTPKRAVCCAVITVSDTRTEATDTSGRTIRELLTEAGHTVGAYRIVRDEPAEIGGLLEELTGNPDLEVLLFNGGTGISRRDTTFDVIDGRLEKRLPGFGELFRMLSYEDIGPAAMLSRATAGILRGKFVVSLPGSSGAVRLGMEKLLLPELSHIVNELAK